jgi:hypothetical protein
MGHRILKVAATSALAVVVALATVWAVLALYYFDSMSADLRPGVAALFGFFGCVVLVGICLRRSRKLALGAFVLGFAGLLVGWRTITPSNHRDWKPEVAILPHATFEGHLITVHDIRNFSYRSESDFTVAYYDRIVDLDRLESIDLIASYWAGPAIAHVMLSFDFGDGVPLVISIERRDERDESYSTIKGLFKQYELIYVVADERDIVHLRTNIRRDPPEQVYLYRVRGERENGRRLFLEYMRHINSLRQRPEFYNTLTTNCTSNIWLHARINPGHAPYSWKILLSGHVPEYLYELGRLDTTEPFTELQRRSQINVAAVAADDRSDFSRRIRAGLPGGRTLLTDGAVR